MKLTVKNCNSLVLQDKCNIKIFLSPVFSNKMLVFRTVIHKMLIRIANSEEPDQTAFSEAV